MKIVLVIASALVATSLAFPKDLVATPKAFPMAGIYGNYDAKHYFPYYTAPDVFEWGYRRNNDPQDSQKTQNFKAQLQWGDAYEGQDASKGPEYYSPPVKVPSYGA